MDINNEEKAYWLGFIVADGCVLWSKKNKCVSIRLAQKDNEHVRQFAKAVGYNSEIKKSRIDLYSKKMASCLIDLGVTPRKTFSVRPWIGDASLMQHYWRGVFDGDGCVTYHDKKRKSGKTYRQWAVSLVGNKSIIYGFKKFVLTNAKGPYNKGNCKPHSSIWHCTYGGIRPCQTVVKLLYNNSKVHLHRKKQLVDSLMEAQLKKSIIAHMKPKELMPLYNKHKNWSKVAKHLGVSHNGMYKHARKLGLTRRNWNPIS